MGLGSILLAVFAFLCMLGGVLFSWMPFLGAMLSFLAPVLALAGIIIGGVSYSRSQQGLGEREGLATAGLISNVIAFVPSVFVALTCGLCNTVCTGAWLTPAADSGVHRDPILELFADAGVSATPVVPPAAPTDPLVPADPSVPHSEPTQPDPTQPEPTQPEPTPSTPAVPGAPTLPPPPLPPGPSGRAARSVTPIPTAPPQNAPSSSGTPGTSTTL